PRGSTAEDLADSIDISSPTLHQHLRTAQQKLMTAFFDDDSDEHTSTLNP
ncbi:helix-turn-helix domain-containing protein, partial [Haloferax sp. ATB1]